MMIPVLEYISSMDTPQILRRHPAQFPGVGAHYVRYVLYQISEPGETRTEMGRIGLD